MAKKRRPIELTRRDIEYPFDGGHARVIRFDPDKMTVEIDVHLKGLDTSTRHIPFAHLPRHIKKSIKPL